MEVGNDGAQEQAGGLFELTGEPENEAFDVLKAATRLHETLSVPGEDEADNEAD